VGVVLGLAAALTSLWFRYGVDRLPEGDPHTTGTGAGQHESASGRQALHHPDRTTTDCRPTEDTP
jgi:hypothetical protein